MSWLKSQAEGFESPLISAQRLLLSHCFFLLRRVYCTFYAATLFILSIRSQGDEVRVSDSDNSHHWCGISMIPTTPTDASGDGESEPGATVKSLIKSFDTVGQSELWAPQHTHKHICTAVVGSHYNSVTIDENSWWDPAWISVISLQ